jgi:YD repeat-containing protein
MEGSDLHNAVMQNASPAPDQVKIPIANVFLPANILPNDVAVAIGANPGGNGGNGQPLNAGQAFTVFVRDYGLPILTITTLVMTIGGSLSDDDSLLPSNTQPGGYLGGKAPFQVTPGTTDLSGQYVDDRGNVQPWTAHYDEFGRLIGRTDYDAGT